VEALGSANVSLRTAAAYVLGTAASNNAKFQGTLLSTHPDIFIQLMEVGAGASGGAGQGKEGGEALMQSGVLMCAHAYSMAAAELQSSIETSFA
jgi:hypothetical protein